MAPKILRSLLLFFLLSNIFIANASIFTINNYDEKVKDDDHNNKKNNLSFMRRVFHVLPRGRHVPASGASKRVNVLQN
ncbi:hypothetical protein TSUD_108370 [Trifolium subterraneum]|nr:hypothetical protein TSUD_108370 [Trifolium subterraneum]